MSIMFFGYLGGIGHQRWWPCSVMPNTIAGIASSKYDQLKLSDAVKLIKAEVDAMEIELRDFRNNYLKTREAEAKRLAPLIGAASRRILIATDEIKRIKFEIKGADDNYIAQKAKLVKAGLSVGEIDLICQPTDTVRLQSVSSDLANEIQALERFCQTHCEADLPLGFVEFGAWND